MSGPRGKAPSAGSEPNRILLGWPQQPYVCPEVGGHPDQSRHLFGFCHFLLEFFSSSFQLVWRNVFNMGSDSPQVPEGIAYG
jgi:hypothetical protein